MLLGWRTQVLDHGYVEVVDYMGNDDAVVQAARISTNKKSKGSEADQRLIDYLMRHRHTSPFEMCELKLLVRAPIFVARQWLRHRTASVNEISGRYVELPSDFYTPDTLHAKPTKVKQGRGEPFDDPSLVDLYRNSCNAGVEDYRGLLKAGVAPEEARMVLPLSIYTEFYWKIDLHNLLHFLQLRMAADAQAEIRKYALAIAGFVAMWVPMTWSAFVRYRLTSVTLSAPQFRAIIDLLRDGRVKYDDLSEADLRELRELHPVLKERLDGHERG